MILSIAFYDQEEICYLGKVSFKIVCYLAKSIKIPSGGLN